MLVVVVQRGMEGCVVGVVGWGHEGSDWEVKGRLATGP